MIFYLRECADGTLLMLDKAGRVNVVLTDIDDASDYTEAPDADPADHVLVEETAGSAAA